MVKLILFDLDGVLIDAKHIHYKALNEAIIECGFPSKIITEEEHHKVYDGLKTKQKLELLTKNKSLPTEVYEEIFELKQAKTIDLINDMKPVDNIVELFKTLKEQGYEIGVCSNSIRRTVLIALVKADLMQYCSVIFSNEDVRNSKPHPEMYWRAMSVMNVLPEETVIVEDSPPGLLAAARSGASYIRVRDPYDVNKENIMNKIKPSKIKNKWIDEKLNVLIPMAGAGSRFAKAGYTFPKPLIDVNGKPMIQVVLENIGLEANFYFVVQKEHREKYQLDNMLGLITPDCRTQIIEVDTLTEGAACTALLAKEFIDNDAPLFFANSDQFVEWNPIDFMYKMQESQVDGGIVTFNSMHPKWSFAKVDEDGYVTEVAEKNPISDNATVGFYYWKHGSDFVKYAEQMIEKDIRVNNEFYVCPVFNEAIQDGKKVTVYNAHAMWGLGTPEDLEHYIKNYKAT